MKKRHQKLTLFQWEVLKAAMTIPIGETRSYQWIAQKIKRPKAVRAVGQALRNNPYPLLIPCHRVIQKDGAHGGYAGKYGKRKTQLLELEKKIRASFDQLKTRPNKKR
jgi:methylated-DNA-[protein]-cysteine S-methyltransferase